MDSEQSYAYFEDVNWGLLRLWGNRSDHEVLDVGCGLATTTQHIQQRGNRVTGIESSEVAVPTARQRIARVIQTDLQDMDAVRREIGSKRFDTIIFADVLEHFSSPGSVLRTYLEFLKPDGQVIVSLPNVGLWSVRLSLLAGRFEYTDTGVLDRTHLRFFTRRSARALLAGAGLTHERTTYNPGIMRPFVPIAKKLMHRETGASRTALLESPQYKVYRKAIYPFERAIASLWPGLLAFQIIMEATPGVKR